MMISRAKTRFVGKGNIMALRRTSQSERRKILNRSLNTTIKIQLVEVVNCVHSLFIVLYYVLFFAMLLSLIL